MNALKSCEALKLEDCPIVDELINEATKEMRRRKDDPIIEGIHHRLDMIERMDAKFAKIIEWLETIEKVTKGLEWLVDSCTKIAIAAAKISIAVGAIWVSVRMSVSDIAEFVREVLRSLIRK